MELGEKKTKEKKEKLWYCYMQYKDCTPKGKKNVF